MNMRLRALRIESGLTQQELAQQINSSNKNIWAYEKGNATPPAEVIIAYAKFFDVSTDYLLGLENDYGARVPAASTTAPAAAMGDSLTAEERQLVEQYRALDGKIKKLVRDQLEIYSARSELVSKTDKKV